MDDRRPVNCFGGVLLEPGASQPVSIGFRVLTTTRDYPMIVDGGEIAVTPDSATTPADTATYTTLFRSTKGKLRNLVPYVQDTFSNASISAHDVTLTRSPLGGDYHGQMQVTVTYNGNAPHGLLMVEANLPPGVLITGTYPEVLSNSFPSTWFEVPGLKFMAGESRTVTVTFSAPADTVPGDLGTGSFDLTVQFFTDVLADVSPADNTPSFALTVVDAS